MHERQIDGYVLDSKFHSRDPQFQNQKDKCGKRHQKQPDSGWKGLIPASELQFDPVNLTCTCPTGECLECQVTRAF